MRSKIFRIVLIVAIMCILCMAAPMLAAATETGGEWSYEEYTYSGTKGVSITGYSGGGTDPYVPATITDDTGNELPVLKIGDGAFRNNNSLNSVTLSSNIRVIGENAFAGAENLLCIVTNEELAEIGAEAFSGCKAFNSIILYSKVKTIGENAFSGCEKLTIYGYGSSYGEQYAGENNIKFVRIGAETVPTVYTIDNVDYYIQNGRAILYHSENTGNLTVPAVVEGYPVTEVQSNAFSGTSIKSVIFPDSITKIGKEVFRSCASLRSVTLPQGIKEIPSSAFYGCTSLEGITLPYGLTKISDSAFMGCSSPSFRSIVIPDSVTNVGGYAFQDTLITDVTFSKNLTKIRSSTFYRGGVKNVLSWGGVTEIESEAFYSCNFESITLPDGLTTVGTNAFKDCSVLVYAIFPDTVTRLANAFDGCEKLELVYSPVLYTVAAGGGYPFIICTSENSSVHSYADANDIPYVLMDEPGIPEVCYDEYGNRYCICDSSGGKYAALLRANREYSGEMILPDYIETDGHQYDVKQIISWAFYENRVTALSLPKKLIKIGDRAFYDTHSLTALTIPGTVKALNSGSLLLNRSSVKEITLEEGVESIGDEAFGRSTGVYRLNLPSTLKTIGSNIIIYDSTSSVTCKIKYVVLPEGLVSMQTDSFYESVVLCVYEDSYAHRFAEENGLSFLVTNGADIIEYTDPEGNLWYLVNGEAWLAEGNKKSTAIVIPETIERDSIFYKVTRILAYAFNGGKIANISLPDSITAIGPGAFQSCKSLQSINIPRLVESIEYRTFYEASYLTSINISSGVKTIGAQAFYQCGRLTVISIPEGAVSIGEEAFYGCSGLTSVSLPSTLESMEARAFENCKSLLTITIPENCELTISPIASVDYYTVYFVYPDSPAHAYFLSLTNNRIAFFLMEDGKAPEHYKINDILYVIQNGNAVVARCHPEVKSNIVIPETVTVYGYPVTEIFHYAFWKCDETALLSISLPETIQSIGRNAFYDCRYLQTINIPQSVTVIPQSAFYYCQNIKKLELPSGVHTIGKSAFGSCYSLSEINIPDGVKSIGEGAFRNTDITNFIIPNGVTELAEYVFADCTGISIMVIPKSVTSVSYHFHYNTSMLLCVYEGSAAHTAAVRNKWLHFVIQYTGNPEIAYGAPVSGTVTYTDGSPAAGATVEILHYDGTVKETVETDSNGAYSFTYAEVGGYTIHAVGSNGSTGDESVSVRRANVFDVILTGTTDIVLKRSNSISGTVYPSGDSAVILADLRGNVLMETRTEDGRFVLRNVPNGTYLLRAENSGGSITKEVTLFNNDLTVDLAIPEAATTVTINVTVKDEDGTPRQWADVTVYDGEGIAVASGKSGEYGTCSFSGLVTGDYFIVAKSTQGREHSNGYYYSADVSGYAYIDAAEVRAYDVEIILLLTEMQSGEATISGKVTAKGAPQVSEVILKDVFGNQVDNYVTGSNGKYKFINIRDGMYFILVTTERNGAGWTMIAVIDGEVYGDTDIWVLKPDKQSEYEADLNSLPDFSSYEECIEYIDEILRHKEYYDSLSDKEKKNFSKEYVEKLNEMVEILLQYEYESRGDVKNAAISGGGMVFGADDHEEGTSHRLILTINTGEAHSIGEDGISDLDDYIQHEIEEAGFDSGFMQYYEITLEKEIGEAKTQIGDVQKDTNSTGKLSITIPIPEEYRGYASYSIIHEHNGTIQILADLDDDPDTITFETDRFSTFVLIGSNTVNAERSSYMNYDAEANTITVYADENATLYIAEYEENAMIDVKVYTVSAEGDAIICTFRSGQTAFLLDQNHLPLLPSITANAA